MTLPPPAPGTLPRPPALALRSRSATASSPPMVLSCCGAAPPSDETRPGVAP
jgi:hypothetical protein